MQESDISAKVWQSCFSDPFSLQSKQLQPDYMGSYEIFIKYGMTGPFGLEVLIFDASYQGENFVQEKKTLRALLVSSQ